MAATTVTPIGVEEDSGLFDYLGDVPITASMLSTIITATAARHFHHIWQGDVPADTRAWSKVAPVCAMVLLALLLGRMTRYARIVAVGLILCLFGDVFMEIRKEPGMAWCFLAGLGSFLTGHVVFIVAFATNTIRLRPSVVVPVFAYSHGVFMYLKPHVKPELVLPVFAYSLAIGSMLVASLCRDPPAGRHARGSKLAGIAGALSFVVSDTVLAINMFVSPLDGGDWLIMSTYYSGVYLIAMSSRGGGETIVLAEERTTG